MAARVVIAGGGPAALEAAVALRRWAPAGTEVTLVAPDPRFIARPLTVGAPFHFEPALVRPLSVLAAAAGAYHRVGAATAVDGAAKTLQTSTGDDLPYDHLVVAIGARTIPSLPAPAVPFSGPWDVEAAKGALEAVARRGRGGEAARLAIVIPAGAGWPFPAYEMALAASRDLRRGGGDRPGPSVALLTPEPAPLAAFGGVASAVVAAELAEAGVEFFPEREIEDYDGVHLAGGGGPDLAAAAAIALPGLRGPELPGLPVGRGGFIRADLHDGRVPGLPGVHAVGDAVDFPVKQGGLACQQADAAAASIAAALGGSHGEEEFAPVLRAELWTGAGYRHLERRLDDHDPGRVSEPHPELPMEGKIAGRFLPGLLAALPEEDPAEGDASTP